MRALLFAGLAFGVLAGRPIRAQAPQTLDDFVQVALRDNRGRQQTRYALEAARAGVREAGGRWLPSATINARYTELSGNVLNFGALLNPAFSALNGLLGQPAFPTGIDLRLPLKQETTVRLQQTLFAPAISAGVAASRAVERVRGAERDQQARQLAWQVRTGYLQWARATKGAEILDATLGVLDEQLRVTERLVANGVATPDAVARVVAERSAVAQQRDDARRLERAAREQFNVLLNRPLDATVPLLGDEALGLGALPALEAVLPNAPQRRDEVRQLSAARDAAVAQQRAAQSAFLPTVGVAIDHGWQGNYYSFTTNRDFTTASVVLSWNLFNGRQDEMRVEQARLDVARLAAQRAEVEQQVALDVSVTHAAAVVSASAIRTARARLDAAEQAWNLVRRRREAGAATLLEALDARTAYTNAQLNLLLTTYDYHLRCAAFERAAALYPRTF